MRKGRGRSTGGHQGSSGQGGKRYRDLAGAGRWSGVAGGSLGDWGTGLSHTAHLCGFHWGWRPAVRVRTSSPPPGRRRSPSRNCCSCWPWRLAPASGLCTRALTRLVGLLRDVVLTRNEVDGLMAGLLTSGDAPTGTTKRSSWLNKNEDGLGRRYVSERRRNFRR